MIYFNIDPKPKDFIHPNGIKRITHIFYGTTPELIPLVKGLCDDPILHLEIGDGIKKVIYFDE